MDNEVFTKEEYLEMVKVVDREMRRKRMKGDNI
jgi:hypothetical protein